MAVLHFGHVHASPTGTTPWVTGAGEGAEVVEGGGDAGAFCPRSAFQIMFPKNPPTKSPPRPNQWWFSDLGSSRMLSMKGAPPQRRAMMTPPALSFRFKVPSLPTASSARRPEAPARRR